MSDDSERAPWDQRQGEPARAYAAFRAYRDLGPRRAITRTPVDARPRTLSRWSSAWDWSARAVAWDDETHRAEDARRLEAIRTMHATHQRVARAAIGKAMEALAAVDAAEIPASSAARLIEIGTRLERDTLTVSVEELQGGLAGGQPDDPFEAIARELTGGSIDPD